MFLFVNLFWCYSLSSLRLEIPNNIVVSRVPAVERQLFVFVKDFIDGHRGYCFIPLGLEALLLCLSRDTATCTIAY